MIKYASISHGPIVLSDKRASHKMRVVSVFMTIIYLSEFIVPICLIANNGPIQQEALGGGDQSNMVNMATGEFSYNIPLLSVPDPSGEGFPISLNYSSAASPESEASWVGYGWSLNTGAIVRNKRGYADDMKGEVKRIYNRTQPNNTITVAVDAGLQLLDKKLGVSTNRSVIYNSIQGWSIAAGYGASFMGFVGLNLNMKDGGDATVTPYFNPMSALLKCLYNEEEREGAEFKCVSTVFNDQVFGSSISHTFGGNSSKPTSSFHYNGESYALKGSVHGNVFHVGANAGLAATYQGTTTIDEEDRHVYGYMHLSEAPSTALTDYSTEKNKSVDDDHRYFLSPSFMTPDIFSITGQSGGGAFRAHQLTQGEVHPNEEKSQIDIVQLGGEVMLGSNFGLSARCNIGSHEVSIGPLISSPFYAFQKSSEESRRGSSVLFRCLNDEGGKVTFDSDNEPISASLNYWDGQTFQNCFRSANRGRTVNQSTFVDYKTFAQLSGEDSIVHKRYSTSRRYIGEVTSNGQHKEVLKNSIAQFCVTRSDGGLVVYGYPTYARNEKSMTYGLYDYKGDRLIPFKNPDTNNLIVYGTSENFQNTLNNSRVGEWQSNPYATSFLLTECKSADYIDKTGDGLSADDFGSWVKLSYDNTTSGTNPWYKWRSPYTGFTYSKMRQADYRDDVASVQQGENEVVYVSKVETKTHIAIFVNNKSTSTSLGIPSSVSIGSAEERKDGFPATSNAWSTALPSHSGSNPLRYLKQIQLWTKNSLGEPDKLIQTVHFVYDYSLMPNHPASMVKNSTTGEHYGKLTLKKIWFENEGVVNARVAPYQFSYATPVQSDIPSYVPSSYRSFYPSSAPSASVENPQYSYTNIDRWGSYRKDGLMHAKRLNPWVSQVNQSDFDPAAWKLKVIALPSGGQIHVQYEQNSYLYVQNQRANQMVNFEKTSSGFEIKKTDIGELTDDELSQLKNLITSQYINGKERMYFRIHYCFHDISSSQCYKAITDPEAEYINGYAHITSCTTSGTGSNAKLIIQFANNSGVPDNPDDAADKFLKTYRNLKHSDKKDDLSFGENVGETLLGTVKAVWSFVDGGLLNSALVNATTPTNILGCQSYLRIPVLKKKLGGGLRVKRLLVYNPEQSLESGGDAALYGSEYFYERFDGKNMVSSGVATNEPGMGREENSIVQIIGDAVWESLIANDDITQCEGPIGESLLPGPSVVYSRVITKNINPYASSTGYSVNDYYTCQDFPSVQMKKTGMNYYNSETTPSFTSMFCSSDQFVKATQGYAFELNSMHGKIKSVRRYPGVYAALLVDPVEPITGNALYEQYYSYYSSGEAIPLFAQPDRPFVYDTPGQEMDITMDGRRLRTTVSDIPIEASFSGMAPVPWLYFSMMVYTTEKNDELRQHVTTKVTSNPIFTKSVTTVTDGIKSVSENLAFSPSTGEPLITRSSDGHSGLTLGSSSGPHNGEITSYKFPSQIYYPGMGQKSNGSGLVLWEKVSTMGIDEHFGDLELSTESSSQGMGKNLVITLKAANRVSTSTAHTENDLKGRTAELLSRLNAGDIICLESHDGGTTHGYRIVGADTLSEYIVWPKCGNLSKKFFVTINSVACSSLSSGVVTCNLVANNYSLNSSTLNGISDVDAVRIVYSGKSNQLNQMSESVAMYGDVALGQRLDFGRYIYNLNKNLDGWNTTLQYFNTSRYNNSYPSNDGVYSQYFSADRNYIWDHPITSGERIDPISSFQIRNIDWRNSGTWGNYTLGITAQNKRLPRELEKSVIFPGPITFVEHPIPTYVWLEMHDSQSSDHKIHYTTGGGAVTFEPQQLDYSGTELFMINDSGDVSFSTYNTANNQVRTPALRLRGGLCKYYNNSSNVCSGCTAPPTTPVDETPMWDVPYPAVQYVAGCRPTKRVAFPTSGEFSTITVLSASAVTYDSVMSYLGTGYTFGSGNDYETGRKGIWRSTSSYAYRDQASGNDFASNSADRNYNSGLVSGFDQFDWSTQTSPGDKWVQTTVNVSYIPDGRLCETYDVLNNMPSAVRYGYSNLVPVMQAKNSVRTSLYFESFEESSGSSISAEVAHTGTKSLKITNSGGISLNTYVFAESRLADAGQSGGLLIRYWHLKNKEYVNQLAFAVAGISGSVPGPVAIAQSGEWTLCEIRIPASQLNAQSSTYLDLTISLNNSFSTIEYVDDLRMQPIYSSATCEVYEPGTFRRVATFDDQHFCTFYQYNDEGTLVRTVKETFKGNFTTKEVESHMPLLARNSNYKIGGTYDNISGIVNPASGSGTMMPTGRRFNVFEGHQPSGPSKQGPGRIDILNIELGLDKKKLKILGQDTLDLNRLKGHFSSDSLSNTLKRQLPTPEIQNLKDIDLNSHTLKNTVKQRVLKPLQKEIDQRVDTNRLKSEIQNAKQQIKSADTAAIRILKNSVKDIEVKKHKKLK